MEELVSKTVPENIRLNRELGIDDAKGIFFNSFYVMKG